MEQKANFQENSPSHTNPGPVIGFISLGLALGGFIALLSFWQFSAVLQGEALFGLLILSLAMGYGLIYILSRRFAPAYPQTWAKISGGLLALLGSWLFFESTLPGLPQALVGLAILGLIIFGVLMILTQSKGKSNF